MASRDADVMVVGAGIMGAAIAWLLARSGRRVVLFEQFNLDHTRGSSHGSSRIFRLAYNDAPYVALAQQAKPLWHEAESELSRTLFYRTGGLDLGTPDDLASIAFHLQTAGIPCEHLSASMVAERFSGFLLLPGWAAIYQPDAGVLDADACRLGLANLAVRHGATVVTETGVTSLSPVDGLVVAETTQGPWRASYAVVAAGAWANRLLDPIGLHIPLSVTREQVGYFGLRRPIDFPIMRWADRNRAHRIYGLRNGTRDEIKVAEHQAGPEVDPDDTAEPVMGRLQPVQEFVRRHLPALDDQPLRTETCLYASTPDDHFVLDRAGAVIVAGGFGGHGFKFGPAIGQAVLEMIEGSDVGPIEIFRHRRFQTLHGGMLLGAHDA